MIKNTLYSLTLLISSAAVGQSSPFIFKGNYLGMTLEQYKQTNRGQVALVPFGATKQKRKMVQRIVPIETPICTDRVPNIATFDFEQPPGNGEVFCDTRYLVPDRNDLTVGGAAVDKIGYKFFNGRLYSISFIFISPMFETIRAAFVDRYGKPFKEESSAVENVFGARWNARTVEWRSGSQSISMAEGENNGPGRDDIEMLHGGDVLFTDKAFAPLVIPSKKIDF